jgi:hypothetical protein
MQCDKCKQKYPVFVREEIESFTCSRCKQNREKITCHRSNGKQRKPKRNELRSKSDLRGKSR